MKKFLTLTAVIVLLASIITVVGCIGGSEQREETAPQPLPLNISVYLDLSDRLIRDLNQSQMERDTAIINQIVDIFIADCVKNGIVSSRNRFQVFFYPEPKISAISTLAGKLNVDLDNTEIKDKKKALKEMKETVSSNIEQIYSATLEQKKWIGSDIWDFFSNGKVDKYCIREGYRNVLFILTDGYLFYAPNKQVNGKAYSYVLPQTLAVDESSLIVKRKGLENLEVIVLEVNPYAPNQRDKLIDVLQNWFKEMEVGNFVVSETDLPIRTQAVIDSFMKKN